MRFEETSESHSLAHAVLLPSAVAAFNGEGPRALDGAFAWVAAMFFVRAYAKSAPSVVTAPTMQPSSVQPPWRSS